jgi:hypothetical protein
VIGLARAVVEALVEDGAARDSSCESDRSGRSNPLELPPEVPASDEVEAMAARDG